MLRWFTALPFVIMLTLSSVGLQADDAASRARDLLRDVIAIKTTEGTNNTRIMADLIKERLLAESHLTNANITRVDHNDMLTSLVVRYPGRDSGKKPMLLLAHMDVVPAEPADWVKDPFVLTEQDGYFFGRGVEDNKTGVVMLVSSFITLSKQGFVPDRDLIMVLTSDEETDAISTKDLLKNHRSLVDGAFALNSDAGGGVLQEGTAVSYSVQASEKIYQSFYLTVKNRGGHSSVPRKNNAINTLARALTNVSQYEFPVELNPVSMGYFKETAKTEDSAIGTAMRQIAKDPKNETASRMVSKADPYYNAVMRTTCIATELMAGHAENALPQSARATVNCRIVPTSNSDSVENTLKQLINDQDVVISRVSPPTPSDPSPLRADVMQALNATLTEQWGLVAVIPTMSTGATDGLYFRNAGIPVYGVSGVFTEPGDSGAHGLDERVKVISFMKALNHWESMIKKLTGADL